MIENLDKLVLRKLKDILYVNDILAERFFKKWGVTREDISFQLNDFGLHGGLWSKNKSIENLSLDGNEKVLNIGPEIGTESLMLAEIFSNVHVADPDIVSLSLLKDISKKYTIESGISAHKVIKFLNYGFWMSTEKIMLEQKNYAAVQDTLGRGLPTYYNLNNTKNVKNLDQKYDVIFIHKILTTLKRFTKNSYEETFSNCVSVLKPLLQRKGYISWTEPSDLLPERKTTIEKTNSKKLVYKIPELNEEYAQYFFQNIE